MKKKYRIIISRKSNFPSSYEVVYLDHDDQSLSSFPIHCRSFREAFDYVKDDITYVRDHHPETKSYFSITTDYSKVVPEKFVDLDIFDDTSMLQLLLSME